MAKGPTEPLHVSVPFYAWLAALQAVTGRLRRWSNDWSAPVTHYSITGSHLSCQDNGSWLCMQEEDEYASEPLGSLASPFS